MPPVVPTLLREAEAWEAGCLLLGVDEVGRGPLAGPVVAAAVVFPAGCAPLAGLRDSKTLSAARRTELATVIRASALAWAVAGASRTEIDRLNILRATALAMRRAIRRTLRQLEHARPRPSTLDPWLLIDGLPNPHVGYRHHALVDGDAHCHSIAAAGILAKVVRDHLMARLHRRHPAFGWDTNAGYGTAAHRAAIATHGPTAHHRRTFSPVAQLELGGGER